MTALEWLQMARVLMEILDRLKADDEPGLIEVLKGLRRRCFREATKAIENSVAVGDS